MAENDVILNVGAKFNASSLNSEVQAAANRAEAIFNGIKGPRFDASNITRGLDVVKHNFSQLTEASNDFGDSLERGIRRISALGAASFALFGIARAFKESLAASRELEKSLTDINVVLNLPTEQLKEFGKSLFDVARNTKQSFEEVSKAALEFSRQGLSTEDTLKRTQAALILVNLAGIDSVSATETITAAINSFSKENLKAIDIVSKLVAVDQNFAVSSKDLAEAIVRVGSVSQDVGVDFNRLISIVTAAQQITQRGGSVIGNALKSIFQRLQRPETLNDLEQLGIQVREVDKSTGQYTGNLLSADRVLKQVAERFKTLTQEQKAQTTQLVAGNLQGNVFRGILTGLSIEQVAYQTALNATDEAIKRNAALLGTQDAKIKNVATSLKELGANIGQTGFGDFISKGLNSITGEGTGIGVLGKLPSEIIKSFSGTNTGQFGEVGNEFGRVFIKSFSDILLGPGLIALAGLGVKITSVLAKSASEGLKGLNPFSVNQQDAQTQKQINQFLSQQSVQINEILQSTNNKVVQERQILELFQKQNVVLGEQAAIRASVAGTVGVAIARSRLSNAADGIPNAAAGLTDAIFREDKAISRGIGGASHAARSVYLPDFNTGDARGIVANTDEYIIKNIGGTGKDAIFNQEMVKQYGLPKGAKSITAATGFHGPNQPNELFSTHIGPDIGLPSKPVFKPQIVQSIKKEIPEATPKQIVQIVKQVEQNKDYTGEFTEDQLQKLLDTGSFSGGYIPNFAGAHRLSNKQFYSKLVDVSKKNPGAKSDFFKQYLSTDEYDRAEGLLSLKPKDFFGENITTFDYNSHESLAQTFELNKSQGRVAVRNAAGGIVVLDKSGLLRVRDALGRNISSDSPDYATAKEAISVIGKIDAANLVKGAGGKLSVEGLLESAKRLSVPSLDASISNISNVTPQPISLGSSPRPQFVRPNESSIPFNKIEINRPQTFPSGIASSPLGRLRATQADIINASNDIIRPSIANNIPGIQRQASPEDRALQGQILNRNTETKIKLAAEKFGEDLIGNSTHLKAISVAAEQLAKKLEEGSITSEQFAERSKKLNTAFEKQQQRFESGAQFAKTQAAQPEFQRLLSSQHISEIDRANLQRVGTSTTKDTSAQATVAAIARSEQLQESRANRLAELDARIVQGSRSVEASRSGSGFERIAPSLSNIPSSLNAFGARIEKSLTSRGLSPSVNARNNISNVGGTLAFAAPFALESLGSAITANENDSITRERKQRGVSSLAQGLSTAGLVAQIGASLGPVGAIAGLAGGGLIAANGLRKGFNEFNNDSAEDTAKRQLDEANISIQRLQGLQNSQGDVFRLQSLRQEGARPEVIRGFITEALKNTNNVSSPVASSQIKNLLLKPSLSQEDIDSLSKTIATQTELENKRTILGNGNIGSTFNKSFSEFQKTGEGFSKETISNLTDITLASLTNPQDKKATQENIDKQLRDIKKLQTRLNIEGPLEVQADVFNPQSVVEEANKRRRVRGQIESTLTPEQRLNPETQSKLNDITNSGTVKAGEAVKFFQAQLSSLAPALEEASKVIKKRAEADEEYQKALNLGIIITKQRGEVELQNLKTIGQQEIILTKIQSGQETTQRLNRAFGATDFTLRLQDIKNQQENLPTERKFKEQNEAQAKVGNVLEFIGNEKNLEQLKGNGVGEKDIQSIVKSLNSATSLSQVDDIISDLISRLGEAGKGASGLSIGLGRLSNNIKESGQQIENSFGKRTTELSLAKESETRVNTLTKTSSDIFNVFSTQRQNAIANSRPSAYGSTDLLTLAQQRLQLFSQVQGLNAEPSKEINELVNSQKQKVSDAQLRAINVAIGQSTIGASVGGTEILDELRRARDNFEKTKDIEASLPEINRIKKVNPENSDFDALKTKQEFDLQTEKEGILQFRNTRVNANGETSFGPTIPSQTLEEFALEKNKNQITPQQQTLKADFSNSKIPDVGVKVSPLQINIDVSSDSAGLQTIIADLVKAQLDQAQADIEERINGLSLELTNLGGKVDYSIGAIQKDTGTSLIPLDFLNPER